MTAVEQLVEEVEVISNSTGISRIEKIELYNKAIEQAKLMEEQGKVEFAFRAYSEMLSTGKSFVDIVNSMRTFKSEWLVKNCFIPDVSNLMCGSFELDNKTSSATRCKCGREKWEHPKAT